MTGLLGVVCLAAMFCAGTTAADAGPALLYDAPSGRVLYAEDADHPWYPASLTKMMTAYVVFEHWKSGRIDRTGRVVISPAAARQPKMRLGLKAGKDISWDDAVTALIMKSANDIATAIAEAAAGTEPAFVDRMNVTAAKLGMRGSHFINAHGLPGEGQHTTARDMAILAEALARDFPEHMHVFGMREAQVGTKRIATHNPVFEKVPGGDGMKTGFTCSAGYNVVASAMRDGRRLVAVVLGEKNKAERAKRMMALLEFGFETADWQTRFPGPSLATLPATFQDRDHVRNANLDQRLKDCTAPEEETEELIAAAPAPSAIPAADPSAASLAPAIPVVAATLTRVAAPKPLLASLVVPPDPVELTAAFTRESPDVPADPAPFADSKRTGSGSDKPAFAQTSRVLKTTAATPAPETTGTRPAAPPKRRIVRRPATGNRDSTFSFAWP